MVKYGSLDPIYGAKVMDFIDFVMLSNLSWLSGGGVKHDMTQCSYGVCIY